MGQLTINVDTYASVNESDLYNETHNRVSTWISNEEGSVIDDFTVGDPSIDVEGLSSGLSISINDSILNNGVVYSVSSAVTVASDGTATIALSGGLIADVSSGQSFIWEPEFKRKCLRLACQALDSTYRSMWKGTKTSADQSLSWPRTGVYDIDGYYISPNSVPGKLKEAQIELALRSSSGQSLVPDITTAPIKTKSTTVGPITTSVTFDRAQPQQAQFRLIDQLVLDFIVSGNRLSRA